VLLGDPDGVPEAMLLLSSLFDRTKPVLRFSAIAVSWPLHASCYFQ